MGAVSTFPDFVDAYRTLLMGRPGLSAVNIFTGPMPDPGALGEQALVIAYEEVTATYEYIQGPSQLVDESYEVECAIVTAVVGAGESGIAAARKRTFDILKEAHDELAESSATTAGSESALSAWDARVVGWKMVQLVPSPDSRSCQLSFRVAVKARFTPA